MESGRANLDDIQRASAQQFDQQAANYGRAHNVLADVSDVDALLRRVTLANETPVLDIATGGGHTALYLARRGWSVTLADVAPGMLERARELLAEEGFTPADAVEAPAEKLPFPDQSFALVTCRVAPHHFSSPYEFLREARRVLMPFGWFGLIDGSFRDGQPSALDWLNAVERWRDPSHGRLLTQGEWEDLVQEAGLTIVQSDLSPMKQPDLEWYFETAKTSEEGRAKVREAVATATPEIAWEMKLNLDDGGKITWIWQRLSLLAQRVT